MVKKLMTDYGEQKILSTGIIKPETLKAYQNGTRRAKPVTVIAVAQALGANWKNYI